MPQILFTMLNGSNDNVMYLQSLTMFGSTVLGVVREKKKEVEKY
jgi:hypothetical protein